MREIYSHALVFRGFELETAGLRLNILSQYGMTHWPLLEIYYGKSLIYFSIFSISQIKFRLSSYLNLIR